MKSKSWYSSILLCLALCIGGICNAQRDTSSFKRAFFGWQLGGGIRQANFSALHDYGYFLSRPPNVSGNIHTTLYFGNPDKLFLSIPIAFTVSGEKKGTYDSNDVRVSASTGSYGALLGRELFRNNNRKFLKALYLSVGANYVSASVTSIGQGKGVVNTDTSFFYEASKAKNILATVELMIELFNLSKGNSFPCYPLALKLGYNMQFNNPKWSYYDQAIQNPTVSRKVNLGGFYATLAVNIWLPKGTNWFKKK